MVEPIAITRTIAIDPGEVAENFIRSSGPGGQNVNKVSSAVQIRFDLRNSPSLPEAVKRRVAAIAGSRLTKDGVLVITANGYRDQPQNRADALARLVALLRQAAFPPKPRVATKPTLGSKTRRLAGKTQRGAIKRLRSSKIIDD
ncbi:alternative ribosome rescue aminoacyl-tRNA hydrolase ArfB [Devosia rhodophyticola]|uniref:Alternative ribosome rescue aminoacyl-tRNA hydrolase ArfB n=1 Tax=Devosia rhodophyticola TaxID=3026423 RepID=A0ABY7YXH9_9HYPH|nr:alternative ribosome rescue aminoacyl-tRNA hydrolase ArfB [Devosia rhodophyticola]WDR05505.1 alternative ribosome rescue aminoacyl-tRNA hydrolase ArfB [Devosia rhodophyticola]